MAHDYKIKTEYVKDKYNQSEREEILDSLIGNSKPNVDTLSIEHSYQLDNHKYNGKLKLEYIYKSF